MKYLKTFFSQEIKKFPITLRKITDFDYRETPSFVSESKPKNVCRSCNISIHDPQISLFH